MLEVRNLKFQYPGQTKAVFTDLNFSLQAGEIVALLGPSGSGKTTLAHMLAGYLKPQAGEIIFRDKKVIRPGRERLLISQENDLFPLHTVEKHLYLVNPDREKNREWLKLVGLEEYSDKYPHELSGGMKKRLSFARALAADSSFIIMDEPFSSQDVKMKNQIYGDLLEVAKNKHKSILLITHDIDEAMKLSDRILVLIEKTTTIINEYRSPFVIDKGVDYEIKRQLEGLGYNV